MRLQSPATARNHGDKDSDHQLQSEGTLNSDFQRQGLQIGCTKNKGESIQVLLTINGIPTPAVADTGAQTTVISEELYQSIMGDDAASTYLHPTFGMQELEMA